MAGHKTVPPVKGAKKWEDSKMDKTYHDKSKVKEGSPKDIKQDAVKQRALNRAATQGKGKK